MTFEEIDMIVIDEYAGTFILQFGDDYYEYDIAEEYDLFTQIIGSGSVPIYEVAEDGNTELLERY